MLGIRVEYAHVTQLFYNNHYLNYIATILNV